MITPSRPAVNIVIDPQCIVTVIATAVIAVEICSPEGWE